MKHVKYYIELYNREYIFDKKIVFSYVSDSYLMEDYYIRKFFLGTN